MKGCWRRPFVKSRLYCINRILAILGRYLGSAVRIRRCWAAVSPNSPATDGWKWFRRIAPTPGACPSATWPRPTRASTFVRWTPSPRSLWPSTCSFLTHPPRSRETKSATFRPAVDWPSPAKYPRRFGPARPRPRLRGCSTGSRSGMRPPMEGAFGASEETLIKALVFHPSRTMRWAFIYPFVFSQWMEMRKKIERERSSVCESTISRLLCLHLRWAREQRFSEVQLTPLNMAT